VIHNNPIAPEQPKEARYPLSALQLFARLTRATYLQLFGAQAPPWDKSRPIKRWFDTSVLVDSQDPDNDIVTYEGWDERAKKMKRIALTVRDAATPNLPGVVSYPKYTASPTPAVLVSPSGSNPVPADYLCTRAEAEAVGKAIGGGKVSEAGSFVAGPFRYEWNGETRRQYVIEWRGERLDASTLLRLQHANGVGAPGRWDLAGITPAWISDVQDNGEQDPRPEVLIPMRKLLGNERIDTTPFGSIVVRVDMSQDQPAAGTGVLTLEQDQRLRSIEMGVNRLLQQ
jgi:hypothetical protein